MGELSSGQNVQKRLVENITLLWTLCETPGEPKENDICGGCDDGRQLSWDREKQLVDIFAFISAWTDDILRVMGVCVEEDPDKMGMTICLASNTGDLSHVTQGFSGIARTLEQASSRAESRFDVRQDLFRQIVALDEPRILSRLRSSHAESTQKTRGKPELLPLLSRTVHDKSIRSRDETAKAHITKIRSTSEQLSQMFSHFEIARGNDSIISVSRDVLIDVLIRIETFDVHGLQTILETSPTIDPSLKIYLPRAMSKLGRYFCVACDLIDAARSSKYTLFRRISIRAMEEPRFDMAFITDQSLGFDQALQKIKISSPEHLAAYDWKSISMAQAKFESRISNCITPWKVHAEMQLLLFYEQRPHMLRPRIISSSKSACFLCDLFIQLHGEFHIPRTHGRLYDRWTIPEQFINGLAANRRLLSVIDRFNATLEAKIMHTLSRKPRPFPHPNESVLLLRQPWSSSSTLPGPSKQDAIHEAADPVRNISPGDQTGLRSKTSPCSVSIPKTSPKRDRPDPQPCVDSMQSETHLTRPIEVFRRLFPGDSTCCKLITPRDTLIVQAGPARVHASWDSNALDAARESFASHRACWVRIEWLSGEGRTARDATRVESVDLDLLPENRDTVVEGGAALGSKELPLQIKGHVVLIKYSFEDPTDTRVKRLQSNG